MGICGEGSRYLGHLMLFSQVYLINVRGGSLWVCSRFFVLFIFLVCWLLQLHPPYKIGVHHLDLMSSVVSASQTTKIAFLHIVLLFRVSDLKIWRQRVSMARVFQQQFIVGR